MCGSVVKSNQGSVVSGVTCINIILWSGPDPRAGLYPHWKPEGGSNAPVTVWRAPGSFQGKPPGHIHTASFWSWTWGLLVSAVQFNTRRQFVSFPSYFLLVFFLVLQLICLFVALKFPPPQRDLESVHYTGPVSTDSCSDVSACAVSDDGFREELWSG